MLARGELKAAVEAILFARSEPLAVEEAARITGVSLEDARIILEEMLLEYNESRRGIQIISSPQGYSMCTRPQYHEYVKKANRSTAVRLSQAALETLAIIAYRQPVTRHEIEAIRGVKADRVVGSLLSRGLIQEVGRKEVPGRPLLYSTTNEFLRLFGLSGLEELPRQMEGEEE